MKFLRVYYKYKLAEDLHTFMNFEPPRDIITDFIEFQRDGKLILKKGYASDGPSGPTIDDETNIQGGFIHDAGYQLMRLGLLPERKYKPLFDRALEMICRIDGMGPTRAHTYYNAVAVFGHSSARQQKEEVYMCGNTVDLRGRR